MSKGDGLAPYRDCTAMETGPYPISPRLDARLENAQVLKSLFGDK